MQKGTYGKFASAEELLRGYNALQQAFTQKCQQLAALTKVVAERSAEQGPNTVDTTVRVEENDQQSLQNNNVDKESPQGINNLSDDGTNVDRSPEFVAGSDVALNGVDCPARDEHFANRPVAQTGGADTGTNQTSPSAYTYANTETLRQTTQAALNDYPTDASVPRNDELQQQTVQSDADKCGANVPVAATSVVRNGKVDNMPGKVDVVQDGKRKIDTYEEISDKYEQAESTERVTDNIGGIDSAHSNGNQSDLLRAQKILSENPRLVAQILSGATYQLPPAVMGSGGNLSLAMPSRPKTLREASELAKKYFN